MQRFPSSLIRVPAASSSSGDAVSMSAQPAQQRGRTFSALQFPISLSLVEQAFLRGFERIAFRVPFRAFKRCHRLIQKFAFRVLLGRQVTFRSLVSRLQLLVGHSVSRARDFSLQSPEIFLARFLPLAALAGVGVKPLARGRVDALRTDARCVGVDRLPVHVATVDLLPCRSGASQSEQGGDDLSVHVSSPLERNRDVWLSVSDFLTLDNLRAVLAQRQRAAQVARLAATGAARDGAPALPHGNHGENIE